jgi:23S rRNA (cytosine1962-C5)-methyltransferase
MLHAVAIELVHPSTGKVCRFTTPPPPEFDAWLADGDRGEAIFDDGEALERSLARAVERRWGLGRSDSGARATTAFRLVNEDGDGLPGLAVDVYGDWLVAQFRPDGSLSFGPERREAILDKLEHLGFDGVYVKLRPKQANTLVDTRREELAPSAPSRGVPAPDPLEVIEEGVPMLVRLGDGLSTGLFLDHRATRRRVRALSQSKSVANLFAYSCGFTVSAALGGAIRTVSVDVSAVAIERGRLNLEHAGVLRTGQDVLVVNDVFSWLDHAGRRGELFDVVVLDPPSYSSTKRARFVAEDDYSKLAAAALAIVSEGGVLLACTNHRGISGARFRRQLFDAGRLASRKLVQVKDLPPPVDYPSVGEHSTKSLLVTVGGAEKAVSEPARGERSPRTTPGGRSPRPHRHRTARRRAADPGRRRSGRWSLACFHRSDER